MDAINELLQLNYVQMIYSFLILAVGFVSVIKVIGSFFEYIGKPLKWISGKNKDHEILVSIAKKLEELEKRETVDTQNSIKHDDILRQSISDLTDKVDLLADRVNTMETNRNKDKLAEYKDSIGKTYRSIVSRVKPGEVVTITKIEKESLKSLIEQYEEHGGLNSFVHTTVEPQMETWIVIDD